MAVLPGFGSHFTATLQDNGVAISNSAAFNWMTDNLDDKLFHHNPDGSEEVIVVAEPNSPTRRQLVTTVQTVDPHGRVVTGVLHTLIIPKVTRK
jgi:hypothetical protein